MSALEVSLRGHLFPVRPKPHNFFNGLAASDISPADLALPS